MCIRHDERVVDDTGQATDIADLFADFVVHAFDQVVVGKYDRRNPHAVADRYPPTILIEPLQFFRVHDLLRSPRW